MLVSNNMQPSRLFSLKVFNALKSSKKLRRRPAFVFQGFKPRHELFQREDPTKGKVNMESDFVIVLPYFVISLECKTTLDSGPLNHAVKQWDELKQVLETELGLGSDFKFIRCLAYQEAAPRFHGSEECPRCQPYLLKFEGVASFLEKFHELIQPPRLADTSFSSFKNIIRDLLIFTSKRENCSDAEERVADAYAIRHSQFMNTPAETVFFWSPEQYDIIKLDKKFVVLKGGELLKNYIFNVGCQKSMQTFARLRDWQDAASCAQGHSASPVWAASSVSHMHKRHSTYSINAVPQKVFP